MSEYRPALTCNTGKHQNRPKTRPEPRTAASPLPPPRLQHLPGEDSHRATMQTMRTIQTTKQCQSLAGTNNTGRLRDHLRARREGVRGSSRCSGTSGYADVSVCAESAKLCLRIVFERRPSTHWTSERQQAGPLTDDLANSRHGRRLLESGPRGASRRVGAGWWAGTRTATIDKIGDAPRAECKKYC